MNNLKHRLFMLPLHRVLNIYRDILKFKNKKTYANTRFSTFNFTLTLLTWTSECTTGRKSNPEFTPLK